jgi:hypothetical protein
MYNKLFTYSFALTDTSLYPARYSLFSLPAAALNNVSDGDYTYTIVATNNPAGVLDTGRLQMAAPKPAPIVYSNSTEQMSAYNPV